MKRFWASWYSEQEPDDIPFQFWITGQTMNEPPAWTYTALFDVESEEKAWEQVASVFSDYQERFISEKDADWQPGDRFEKPSKEVAIPPSLEFKALTYSYPEYGGNELELCTKAIANMINAGWDIHHESITTTLHQVEQHVSVHHYIRFVRPVKQ